MSAAFAGVALGLASSLHCAAMCGPLVLTIGRRGERSSTTLRHALLYHVGRIAMYAVVAAPLGLAGERLVLEGFGRGLALAAGVLLLMTAVFSARLTAGRRITSAYSSVLVRVSGPLLRWARGRPVTGALAAGALNGLLPCGLLYAALAAAGATGSPAGAVLLMTGFGIGTAPVLIAMQIWAAALPAPVRLRLRPLGPLVLAVTAALVLARGMTAPHQHADPAPPGVHHSHH